MAQQQKAPPPVPGESGASRKTSSPNRTGGRWIGSSRRNPCPLCGRDTDDKCRRQADLISCWHGSRFHPPAGLRLGDVLTLEGRDWAVVALAGGFGGNSLNLRPHRPRRSSSRRRSIPQPQRRTPPPEWFWAQEPTSYSPCNWFSYHPTNWIVAALYQRHCLRQGWEVPL